MHGQCRSRVWFLLIVATVKDSFLESKAMAFGVTPGTKLTVGWWVICESDCPQIWLSQDGIECSPGIVIHEVQRALVRGSRDCNVRNMGLSLVRA